MALRKISALPAATSIADADLIPIVNGGATKTATPAQLRSSVNPFVSPRFKAHDTVAPTTAGEDITVEGGAGTLLDEVGTNKNGAFRVKANGFCLGYDASTSISGAHSLAIGYDTTALGTYTIAIGGHCHSTAAGATAVGESCTASGPNAVAIGWNNTSSAYSSVAIGMYLSALAEGSFVCGVNATARQPGEFVHGSGHSAKVGFANINTREIGLYVRANGATGTCKMRDGNELTLQEYCLSSVRVRISAGTTSFGKVACEEATFLVKTTAGSVSTIIGTISWTTFGQTFASQGWGVTISIPSGKTLRISCNPGVDDVEFFARAEWMDQAL